MSIKMECPTISLPVVVVATVLVILVVIVDVVLIVPVLVALVVVLVVSMLFDLKTQLQAVFVLPLVGIVSLRKSLQLRKHSTFMVLASGHLQNPLNNRSILSNTGRSRGT